MLYRVENGHDDDRSCAKFIELIESKVHSFGGGVCVHAYILVLDLLFPHIRKLV